MKTLMVTIVCLLLLSFAAFKRVWNVAYDYGVDRGFVVALDTVQAIIDQQYRSDTSVTKLVLINPDTTTYYISRITVLQK